MAATGPPPLDRDALVGMYGEEGLEAFRAPAREGNTVEHSEIIPGWLYLASGHAVEDEGWMEGADIRTVVNVAGSELGEWYPRGALTERGMALLEHDIVDSDHWVATAGETTGAPQAFEDAAAGVLAAWRGAAGPHAVLVHCSAGRSRSATVVLWLLLTLRPKWTVLQAWGALRALRTHAYPNLPFTRILLAHFGSGGRGEPDAPTALIAAAEALQTPIAVEGELGLSHLLALHPDSGVSVWADPVGDMLALLALPDEEAQRVRVRAALQEAGGDVQAAATALLLEG